MDRDTYQSDLCLDCVGLGILVVGGDERECGACLGSGFRSGSAPRLAAEVAALRERVAELGGANMALETELDIKRRHIAVLGGDNTESGLWDDLVQQRDAALAKVAEMERPLTEDDIKSCARRFEVAGMAAEAALTLAVRELRRERDAALARAEAWLTELQEAVRTIGRSGESLAAAREEVERLRGYAVHRPSCATTVDEDCDCGLAPRGAGAEAEEGGDGDPPDDEGPTVEQRRDMMSWGGERGEP